MKNFDFSSCANNFHFRSVLVDISSYLHSVVADGKDGDGLHFEKFSFNFSKLSYPSLRQNECTMDYSSCRELIDVLVLSFKAMFSARVKVRKKDFCIRLARKQPKCRDRAPLTHTPYFSAPFSCISL